MTLDYEKYDAGHWSQDTDVDSAVSNYIKLYEDVYNQFNVERIVSAVPTGGTLRILDYGGGIGMLSVALAELGHDVTLVDAAPGAVEAAGVFAARQGVVFKSICTADVCELPVAELYDVIVSKDLIEHVHNDEALVKQFFLRLKPKGVLVLTTQNKFCMNYLIEAGVRKILRPHDKWMGWDRTHLRFYTSRSLSRICTAAGFKRPTFRSAYIIPYKLLGVIFPAFDAKKPSILSSIDKALAKLFVFGRCGWNIMVIAEK